MCSEMSQLRANVAWNQENCVKSIERRRNWIQRAIYEAAPVGVQVADMDSANIELEDANTQLEATANAAEQRCADLEQEVQKLQSAQSTLKVCHACPLGTWRMRLLVMMLVSLLAEQHP